MPIDKAPKVMSPLRGIERTFSKSGLSSPGNSCPSNTAVMKFKAYPRINMRTPYTAQRENPTAGCRLEWRFGRSAFPSRFRIIPPFLSIRHFLSSTPSTSMISLDSVKVSKASGRSRALWDEQAYITLRMARSNVFGARFPQKYF